MFLRSILARGTSTASVPGRRRQSCNAVIVQRIFDLSFHSCLYGLRVLHRYPPALRAMPTVPGATENFQKVWCADRNEVNDAYSPQFKV